MRYCNVCQSLTKHPQLQDILSLFLVDQGSLQDHSLYQQLDAYIAPHLSFLAPILNEHYNRKHGYANVVSFVLTNARVEMKTNIAMYILTT